MAGNDRAGKEIVPNSKIDKLTGIGILIMYRSY
jgi:hypothetical protein